MGRGRISLQRPRSALSLRSAQESQPGGDWPARGKKGRTRALRPTDVLAHLSFRRQSPDNEALCGADGQTLAPKLVDFLGDSLAIDNRRAHWALFERGL